MGISRRHLITGTAALTAVSAAGFGLPRLISSGNAPPDFPPIEITWDDLIPPGVPYAEIIGEGEMDVANDIWRPIYDANATKLNPTLDGAYIKMPGFIIPIDLSTSGVTSFVLVPYVGACLHTPPPPPNQLVYVTTDTAWPSDNLWDAVWVTGQMRHEMQTTEVADTGYQLHANAMDVYVW